jgi:hypothetical protein
MKLTTANMTHRLTLPNINHARKKTMTVEKVSQDRAFNNER